MRLLQICDHLDEIGGVSNYTRPLYHELKRQGADVTVLCTSPMLQHYHLFRRSGIREVGEQVYEYFNCPLLQTNYSHPANDVSNYAVEKELRRFLAHRKFDIAHIHSMVGLPATLYSILKESGIPIVTTVHEYWWLCPYRVMVDFNNRICDGPEDCSRCAFCTDSRGYVKNDQYRVFVLKLAKTFPRMHRLLFRLYRLVRPEKAPVAFRNLEFGEVTVPKGYRPEQSEAWHRRLDACIGGLNLCEQVIGVSDDVKRLLVKYGVESDRIMVQHIGSVIAEQTIVHTRMVDPSDVAIGFIGGVGFYKGVHQMVQAFTLLPEVLKSHSRLEIYGKYDQRYVDAIVSSYLKNEEDRRRVTFHGRFRPDEIPFITNQIDLSVLPSLCADTAPQTIFESFSAGLPIIAPRVGGFPDFIKDGVNGLLYLAGDVKSLSACMQRVLEEPSMIIRFRSAIPKTKSLRENAAELLDLYHTLC